MKIPKYPPSAKSVLKDVAPERFYEIMAEAKLVDDKGRYLHWDQLRHKKPPDGLTAEEWWMSVRFARQGSSQRLSLYDVNDKPFFYTEPPEMKSLLRFIDMNAGGSLGSGKHGLTTEDGRRYMRRSLAEEPFASSYIEGAVTTRDIAKKMIFENRPPHTKDERMVLNNYRAMEFVKEIQDDDLTPEIILELHRVMTEETLDDASGAGRLRTDKDNVHVVDDTTGEILHTPPPAETLENRLKNLCDFANATDDDLLYCHPMFRAMALHFMIGYDHPFIDGNGRTARTLFYWHLIRTGYWLMEYTSISSIIAQAADSYYKAFLYSETDGGDLTYFFLHQARVTKAALQRTHDYADEKRREFEQFQKVILEQNITNPLNERQVALIQDLALGREKLMTIMEHQKRHGVSYLTARTDLEDLVSRGLSRKMKKGKSSVYHPTGKLSKKILNVLENQE